MVIAQAAGPVPAPEWTDHGPIKICFVGGLHSEYPQCTSSYSPAAFVRGHCCLCRPARFPESTVIAALVRACMHMFPMSMASVACSSTTAMAATTIKQHALSKAVHCNVT